jgi:hypothetical protein
MLQRPKGSPSASLEPLLQAQQRMKLLLRLSIGWGRKFHKFALYCVGFQNRVANVVHSPQNTDAESLFPKLKDATGKLILVQWPVSSHIAGGETEASPLLNVRLNLNLPR